MLFGPPSMSAFSTRTEESRHAPKDRIVLAGFVVEVQMVLLAFHLLQNHCPAVIDVVAVLSVADA